MPWQSEILERLSAAVPCGYHANQPPATEPTALAALALIGAGMATDAVAALQWLVKIQAADGSLGVTAEQAAPQWPTAWAVMAWVTAQIATTDRPRLLQGTSGILPLSTRQDAACTFSQPREFRQQIANAIHWIAAAEGQTMHAVPELGHDPNLKGWPGVEGTNSWIEPTALALLALKAAGQSEHPRAKEAVRLLYERQMPHGGCNYGNTVVMGQELVPHVQPTGLTMLSLAGEQDPQGNIERGLNFLLRSLDHTTATASLCYGLFALTAHGERPKPADAWLQAAAGRTLAGDRSPYKLALLALAAQGEACPLIQLVRPSLMERKS